MNASAVKKCGAKGYGSQPEDEVDPGTNQKL